VPVAVRPADLNDRDELVRALNQQFRKRLECDADLGTIELANFFQKPGRFLRERFARRSVKGLLQTGYSAWYAYFGSLDVVGDQFCGVPIEDVYYCASSWPPMSLTLLINRFRGRLLFQATYIPDTLPQQLVNEFLDAILSDIAV
jgi:hypothetical protein